MEHRLPLLPRRLGGAGNPPLGRGPARRWGRSHGLVGFLTLDALGLIFLNQQFKQAISDFGNSQKSRLRLTEGEFALIEAEHKILLIKSSRPGIEHAWLSQLGEPWG